MNTATVNNFWLSKPVPPPASRKELFRERFQRSLRSCVQRGFSVEESFGMIWVETWEEISLTEGEQASLYDELIGWAQKLPQTTRYQPYSQTLFTA